MTYVRLSGIRRALGSIALAGVMLLSAATAHATVIQESHDFGPISSSTTLSFHPFDSSLGTLTAVTFHLTSTTWPGRHGPPT